MSTASNTPPNPSPNQHPKASGDQQAGQEPGGTKEPKASQADTRQGSKSRQGSDARPRGGWVRFVALRYLKTRRREKRNTTAILSVLALSAGLATLITVIAVMNALQSRSIESVLAVQSFHLRIEKASWKSYLGQDDHEASLTLAIQEAQSPTAKSPPGLGMLNAVSSFTRFAEQQALIRGAYIRPQALYLRALAPDVMERFKEFAHQTTVVRGELRLDQKESIALGWGLARTLGVDVGDSVTISYLEPGGSLVPKEIRYRVSALLGFGYGEYDYSRALVSYEAIELMQAGQVRWQYGLMLKDKEADLQAMYQLQAWFEQRPNASSSELLLGPEESISQALQSWRSYNASFFGALRLEKLMMMLMVGLIFIVVAVNIYYALRRSVLEKSEDIALLRALGALPSAIQRIFIVEGLVIGTLGAALGTLLGVLISLNINGIFSVIRSIIEAVSGSASAVNLLYLDRVPGVLYTSEVFFMAMVALASAVVAAFGASRRVSRLKTTEILRNE